MSTTTETTAAVRDPATRAPRRTSRPLAATYARLDLRRQLRDRIGMFFIVALPAFFFFVFGMGDDEPYGSANVAMYVMVSMAAYGAVTATTTVAGAAATEQRTGWGRQVALTPMSPLAFVAVKTGVAMTVAAVPITLIFAIGAVTGSSGNAVDWLASGAVTWLGSAVFAVYGLAVCLLFKGENAAGIASGLIVIMAFLGNVFTPMDGLMLQIGHLTPLYGYAGIARYPISEGRLPNDSGTDELWMLLANVGAWTVIFAALAVWGTAARSGTRVTPTPDVRSVRSPWERWGWLVAGVWLIFLFYPVAETLQTDSSLVATALTLTCIAIFAVIYLLGWGVWRRHALAIWLVLVLLMLVTVPTIGIEALGLTPFLGAFSAMMVPAPWWKWTTVVSALLPILSLVAGEFPAFFFMLVWPIIGFCTAMRVFAEAEERSEEARSAIALVAERERVARDVHDVLGHSLTALCVKAELAGRLIDVDPARARLELESIQETARQALAEVRATVGGLRAGNLDAELATLPRVLADAGVETTVEGSVADTDPRHRTLLAWVLRESVTNVVRHAHASNVVIRLDQSGVVVADDGTGCDESEGNGLRGMRERVSAAGGTLEVTPATPGTRLQVVLP